MKSRFTANPYPFDQSRNDPKTRAAGQRFARPTDFPAQASFVQEAPTQGFMPRTPVNVQGVLAAKHLVIMRDPATGHLRSRDGRNADLNEPLSAEMSYDYPNDEAMQTRMRQIAATEQSSGMIFYNDVGMLRHSLLAKMKTFQQAGLIKRYDEYPTGIYVVLNPDARPFLSKTFAQLCVVNYLRTKRFSNEIFYDVHLDEDRGGNDHYTVDVIYRQGTALKFIVIALNPKLDQMQQQMERIVRIANRLRSSVTILVSPSVDARMIAMRINAMTDSRADAVSVVTYPHLSLLP